MVIPYCNLFNLFNLSACPPVMTNEKNNDNLNGESPELESGKLEETIHLSDMY